MAILGTTERPAVVRVETPERAQAVMAICRHRGWQVITGIEPGEREDSTDLELLLTGGQAISSKVGRNELCPCGSGKKQKKCCLGGPSAVEALVAATVAKLGGEAPALPQP